MTGGWSAEGRRAYGVYLVLTGGEAFFRQIIRTVLAVYFVTVLGLNPFQLVIVGTVLEATCFLLEVPTGVLADAFSRKWSVVIGLLLAGLAYAVIGLVPLFGAILIAQVARGLGETLLNGADRAWVADEVGEAHVRHVFIRGAQVGHVAAIIGSLASVALASIHLQLPIWLGGAALVALGAGLAAVMREPAFRRHAEAAPLAAIQTGFGAGVRAIRLRPVVLAVLLVACFHGASSQGVDRLWEAHFLTEIGLPGLGALEPIVWFGVIGAVARLLAIAASEIVRHSDDSVRGARRTLIVVDAALVVCVAGFGVAGEFYLAALAYLTASALHSVESPLYDAWLARQVEPRVRATVLSMSSQLDALGQITGGPLVGAIGTVLNLRAAMIASAGLLIPALGLYAWIGRGTRLDQPVPARPPAEAD